MSAGHVGKTIYSAGRDSARLYRLNHFQLLQDGWLHSLNMTQFDGYFRDDICGPKWRLKCSRNFRLSHSKSLDNIFSVSNSGRADDTLTERANCQVECVQKNLLSQVLVFLF